VSGIFEDSIFGEGPSDLSGLGELPSGAAELSRLNSYSRSYNLPNETTLRSKGATHFTARQGNDGLTLSFFTDEGAPVTSLIAPAQGAATADPETSSKGDGLVLPARQEGDGLLPGQTTAGRDGVNWVPYAVAGGGLLLAGGIVYALARPRKKPVTANRRRRKTTRRR